MKSISPTTVMGSPLFLSLDKEEELPPSRELTLLVTDIVAIAADLFQRMQYHGRKITLKIISDQNIHPSFYKIRGNFRKIRYEVNFLKDPESQQKIQSLFECLISMRKSMLDDISVLGKRILGHNFVRINGPFKNAGISCFNKIPKTISSENIVSIDTLKKMERIFRALKANTSTILIGGNESFKKQVIRSFTQILSYPNGFNVVKILLNKKISISIEPGEQEGIKYGFPHLISLNPIDRHYPYTIIKGKMYSYYMPKSSVLMHELIHALHWSDDFSKANQIIYINPNFRETHAHDWTDQFEAAVIGLDGDNDPFTENNFSGTRGTMPKRYSHHSIRNIQQLTDKEKFMWIIDEQLDGDVEYMLQKNPNLINLNTHCKKYELFLFAQKAKNRSLVNLLVSLNCPTNQEEAVFEDFKLYLNEKNIDRIQFLIENYNEFFDYKMLMMMRGGKLFKSPKVKEFMELLFLRLFPSL